MEGLKNIMEDDVENQLNQLLPTMPNICSCETCRLDMATYALNRLKPNYVRTNTGALFHKLNTSSTQANYYNCYLAYRLQLKTPAGKQTRHGIHEAGAL